MVSRVAQTLHELALRNGGQSRGPGDMKEDARAILAAIRDPTKAMVDAGGWDGDLVQHDAVERWQRMLDAALVEVR